MKLHYGLVAVFATSFDRRRIRLSLIDHYQAKPEHRQPLCFLRCKE